MLGGARASEARLTARVVLKPGRGGRTTGRTGRCVRDRVSNGLASMIDLRAAPSVVIDAWWGNAGDVTRHRQTDSFGVKLYE